MASFKILFFLTVFLFAGKNPGVKNVNESEYLTYCSTEKRELCKWTPSLYLAREAAKIHLIEYKEHHIELWERRIDTTVSMNLRRAIKITKLNPATLTPNKFRHF